ncbi:PAS domain-containing protein [Rhizobium sp. NTR19]|uniref:histidine kinase n=1 Tax=Neorhizobium turbinariae TaxID=2937795 RepID=A0ABT0IWJ2_9HYPH|nr:PAS domain-containing protein [Neorhizobium turbinariae]MCK8782243.1 PAS domain-containing protein [Neorhizobium turbinariae]
MEADLRRLFDDLPGLVWACGPDGVTNFVNRRWRDYAGITIDELRESGWIATIHPDDIPAVRAAWRNAVETESSAEFEMRLRRFDGVYRRFIVKAEPFHDSEGRIGGWFGVNSDIESQRRAETELEAEKQLLELVAHGVALPEILHQICLQVERIAPGSLCSILFSDPDELRFRLGAGPNLPAPYNAILDGLKIDPFFGPCSLAITTKTTIFAIDPPTDPRWSASAWPGMMTEFGLGSCWSAPIIGSGGQVLGIFAIYRRECVGPTAEEEELIDRFAKLSGIAMERANSDAMLAASAADLRRANHFLAGAQRLSKTGSFTLDPLSDEQVWSDENYRIWEFDPAVTPTMEMVRAAIHPEDLDVTYKAFEDAIHARENVDLFYRIVTPVAGVKYLHTVMEVIPEMADRLIYLGSSQDVTDIKLSEIAFRESESSLARANVQLSAAQRLSQTGSFTWDSKTLELNWSEENYRIWDFDPAILPDMAMIVDALHPEDRATVLEGIERAVHDRSAFDAHYRVVTRSGAVKYLHTVSMPVPEITSHAVFLGSTQDVTDTKLTELALRTREAELERTNSYLTAVQRLSQTGSFTWDLEQDEHNWSDVIYEVFGFEPGTNVTMEMIAGAIHPEDMINVEALLRGAAMGQKFALEFRVLRQSGEMRYAQVIGHRVDQISDRPVFMGALQDITSRKLAEAELNHARAELAHVARVTALGALTASITHEVSQPLAGILTNASACLRMLAADPPDLDGAKTTVQRTIRDGNRASEVIKRLRGLFTRKPPILEWIHLGDAAREVLALCSSELQRRGVFVRTDLRGGLPSVLADRVQIQQVILNLVLNAADAMAQVDGHGRELQVSSYAEFGGDIVLSVRDAGVGIDPSGVEQLFQAFHTTKENGMGIGLSISRSIIEAHGGRLWGTPNTNGPGSTFAFSIPRDANAAELGRR